MNLDEMTREDALNAVRAIAQKDDTGSKLNRAEKYLLAQIEYFVERRVIADIVERQKKIPSLSIQRHGYSAVWGGDLTPGCRNCLDRTLKAIRSVSQCNVDCSFCYYRNDPYPRLLKDQYVIGERLYTKDDIKMMYDKCEKRPASVSWVYFEPFMDFDKHPELIQYLSGKGIHQHLYTNGTLCTEEQFKMLRDSGLTEIRFNLAASNCARKVLRTMKVARNYFTYLCIESPSYDEFFPRFMERKDEILDTGVDHINLAELHVGRSHKEFLREPLYRYKYGYTSPISSRQRTYDIIETASREKWSDVTINDCSNATKFYRSFASGAGVGNSTWSSEMELPMRWYVDALLRHELSCFAGAADAKVAR